MDGTYNTRFYTSKDVFEEVPVTLSGKSEHLCLSIPEMLYRPLHLTDGALHGDSFSFKGVFTTILADIPYAIQGAVKDDVLSGVFETPLGKIPFTGLRVPY